MTNFHKTFLSILLAVSACLPATAAEPRPFVVAHRGLLRHAPENTLANFRACLELQLGFEFDVERTKDGYLVCIHDDTVDRTTDGSGKVNEMTLDEIRKLDAGSWFDAKFAGEKVPTVEDVLELVAEYRQHNVLIAVDLANNRMIVRSNKTPPTRCCPIFPELRPHLLRAREMSSKDAEYLQTRYSHDANILTTLQKIVKKAGITPWPKLMQNLRATREAELLANYPAKDVTSWLGNSPNVANKHYAMALQASFDRAVFEGAKIEGVTNTLAFKPKVSKQGAGEAVVDSKTPLKTPPTMQDTPPLNPDIKASEAENTVNNWVRLALALNDLPLSCPTRTRT